METFRSVIGEAPSTAGEPVPLRSEAGAEPLTALFGRFPTIAEVEDYMIEQALKMAKGNQGMAAGLLGIGRQTLNKRLNKTTQQ